MEAGKTVIIKQRRIECTVSKVVIRSRFDTSLLIPLHYIIMSGKVYCSHTGISLMCPILRFRSEYGIRIVMHHGHHLALEVSRSTIYAVTAG